VGSAAPAAIVSERDHVEANCRELERRTERLERRKLRRAGQASRRKGKDGEAEFAALMRNSWGVGFVMRGHSADIASTISHAVHVEVKRVERLDVPGAYRQAVAEARGRIAVVAHRSSRQPWLITLEAAALPMLVDLLRER
jgi:hypothetical protein